MSGETYELFWQDVRVGTVSSTRVDTPEVWATLQLNPELAESTSAKVRRLTDFIQVECEYIRLYDAEDGRDVSSELSVLENRLETYLDISLSDEWVLIDSDKQRIPIRFPLFRAPDEIVFSEDFSASSTRRPTTRCN